MLKVEGSISVRTKEAQAQDELDGSTLPLLRTEWVSTWTAGAGLPMVGLLQRGSIREASTMLREFS